MLLITKRQFEELNDAHLNQFVKKMQKTIIENLGEEYAVEFIHLKKLVKKAIDEYFFSMEICIEDFILLYSQFPLLRQDLTEEIEQVLLSQTKREEMKIEELTEFALINRSNELV